MKTYNDFLAESTLATDQRSVITKLGAALVEAEKLHKTIEDLAEKLRKETVKYSKGPASRKLEAIINMCSKPEEVAKNGTLLKQRLEQHTDVLEKE